MIESVGLNLKINEPNIFLFSKNIETILQHNSYIKSIIIIIIRKMNYFYSIYFPFRCSKYTQQVLKKVNKTRIGKNPLSIKRLN